jgi:cell division protein FtsA
MLNGGIVLTGGGAQLRHLIQLTEYTTGLNARIGYPNEHLAPGRIEELAKPTYSTCIGLILKGYSDYEHNRKQFETRHVKVEIPEGLRKQHMHEEVAIEEGATKDEKARNRRGLKDFWGKFKVTLIDLFKEEEDQAL